MAKKKTSSGSSQASLPLGGAKRKVAVKSYTRTFSKSKLPPRAKNGKFRKR